MLNIINHITEQTNLSAQQAWWLLEFVTDKSRPQLQFSNTPLTHEQQQNLDRFIHQIAVDHKPLAYILGWVPFLDLKLKVMPPTLIPRLETEFWINEVIEMLQQSANKNLAILDMGTGSGCIALSLAQAFPTAHIYAVDIAVSALQLAQQNADINNIKNVTFLQSDIFKGIPANLKFDLIVSNPPYIDPAAQLATCVLNWEDHEALFAKNKGMQIIEQIVAQAQSHLKKNDAIEYQLIMEIDVSQGNTVKTLAENYGFSNASIKKDQFDRDRTLWAQKK